jgi:putative phosphoesterase
MKIGILSDTHNNIENTQRALEIYRKHRVSRLIHCGDITSVSIVEMLKGFQATFVFGNMDQFHADLLEAAKKVFGMGSMGYNYTADIDGARIAVCHGDDSEMLEGYIQSGLYDYVFHGHTHLRRDDRVGETRVINPGALGGKQKEPRSLCILDLKSGQASFYQVEESVNTVL